MNWKLSIIVQNAVMSGRTVVTTFAGRGGSSIGYNLAKCNVLLAIDFEPNAVNTYKLNFPKTTVWKANIRQVTGLAILKEIGMKRGELDIFDGSPPCTPFSAAGKREKSWNKVYKHGSETQAQRTDDLFFEYLRLVREIQPKSFIAENVKGMIIGKSKGYYNLVLRHMKKLGYNVRVFNINAKDFEVPQSRPRIVFIGVRKDIKTKFPELHTFKEITFGEAVKNLQIPSDDLQASINAAKRPSIEKYLRYVKPGESFSRYHPKGNQFTYVRVSNDRPCPTITAGGYMQMFHPIYNRALTVAEAKRCSTFPDDYKFLSLSDGWLGVGNSVPPKLIMHMANYVQQILANAPTISDRRQNLRSVN
ncbi:MAG: DNA cytosine methyltransferase [Nitrosarchaeum sp.]|nr:DNA cytosine methyltransferase [Nitrosarchaeum sp.]